MPCPRRRTPGTKIPVKIRSHFAGGHRSRVTPVPIPNTEVKPATADGTARETVWESRSLPALFVKAKSPIVERQSGLLFFGIQNSELADRFVSLLLLPTSQLKTIECGQRTGGHIRFIEARPDAFHRARETLREIDVHRCQKIHQLSKWRFRRSLSGVEHNFPGPNRLRYRHSSGLGCQI